jgi:hypothetical protein
VSEHFIIHSLEQTPQKAATLIRDFIAMNDDWSLNGEFEMMGGAAVGMKICFNAMRRYVAEAGLHNMAMMPCGNIAFYEEGGQSFLSMLDVGSMTALSPILRSKRAWPSRVRPMRQCSPRYWASSSRTGFTAHVSLSR